MKALTITILTQILSLSTLLSAASPPCPLVLSYVSTFTWNTSSCQNLQTAPNTSTCCQTLQSIYGLALAQRLRDTNLFLLPDTATSVSCLDDFQSNLRPLPLPDDIVSWCFDPSQFVIANNTCAGIESGQDWADRVGTSTELNSACGPDLADFSACDSCVAAGLRLQARLVSIDGNTNDSSVSRRCYFDVVLYAAGISNYYGPLSYGVITCILSFQLNGSTGDSGAESPIGNRSSNRVLILVGVVVSVVFLSLCCLLGWYVWWGRVYMKRRNVRGIGNPKLRTVIGSVRFEIRDLEKATNNFSPKNSIGRGGFGVVYRGILPDGTEVAVKQITATDFQGDAEFSNEVEIVSNLRHRNLVTLRGCCCVVTEWYLVYDYMVNGNLGDRLFPSPMDRNRSGLTWMQRKNIVLDVARGIEYLHNGVRPAIFHRDVKATNILLDTDMRAKLADFGLARRSREGLSHDTTRVAGTHGYLAPEYALYGQLTVKNDVYSFGVVVLEVMSGRRALDSSWLGSPGINTIADWARVMVRAGKVEEALDDSLLKDKEYGNRKVRSTMERFVRVGILCTHLTPAMRPTVADALTMLEGDVEVPPIPDTPMTPLRHPMYL